MLAESSSDPNWPHPATKSQGSEVRAIAYFSRKLQIKTLIWDEYILYEWLHTFEVQRFKWHICTHFTKFKWFCVFKDDFIFILSSYEIFIFSKSTVTCCHLPSASHATVSVFILIIFSSKKILSRIYIEFFYTTKMYTYKVKNFVLNIFGVVIGFKH